MEVISGGSPKGDAMEAELAALRAENERLRAQSAPAPAPKSPSVQTVTVDGVEVSVDVSKFSSWRFVRLFAKTQDDRIPDDRKIAYMLELIDFLLGDQEDAIVEHFGGDSAQLEDVMGFVARLFEVVSPKK